MNKILNRLWNSATVTTWGSLTTRTLSLLLVLPLLLTRLSTGEIALWYLFSSIITLQTLVDLGFSPTFTRVIAYAMGGAENLKDLRGVRESASSGKPNWSVMERIWSTIRSVYLRLTSITITLLAVIGTVALLRPISQMEHQSDAWISWFLIVVISGITSWGTMYSSFLQGINQIAVFRRWEALTSLGATATSIFVLYAGGKILELVVANQAWAVIAVIRNRWLCRSAEHGKLKAFRGLEIDDNVLSAVWPSAWRSGLGITMSFGLVQATGLIYAQFGSAAGVASYLIALKLIQTISLFSQAPFYSKLPLLARLRSEGKLADQIAVAQRGMVVAYWTFVLCFLLAGFCAHPLLSLIKSQVQFVDPLMWSLMGIAFFVERYGAMHIQLYSTTNHIIWHIATGFSGIINILVNVLLFRYVGVYSFPIGILSGYLGFYCWYSAMYSYRAFKLDFWSFERRTVLVPLAVVLAYSVLFTFFPR